ncbi:MAG TPA: hypothetical protein VF736_01290 [Pyrinomonadaceae bacterium]
MKPKFRGAGAAFTLALVMACAGEAAAQFTNCPPALRTLSGSPMYLHLNSSPDPSGRCQPDPNSSGATPGGTVTGCYDGTETDPFSDNHILGHGTICTVCQFGDPGCFAPLPPDFPTVDPTQYWTPQPPPGWPSDPYDPFRDLGDPPMLNFYYGYDFYYYGHFPA